MKNSILFTAFCLFQVILIQAQHKGNFNHLESGTISRQNIATSGNATIYNPTERQHYQKTLTPSSTLTIDVKALQNVTAASYTAVFNLSQIGSTADSTNLLMDNRINSVKNILKLKGVLEKDISIDVISFVPKFELEVVKKIFSKTYNEVPIGFELQKNLLIKFQDTKTFETILKACASNEIYNLVKVDYFIEDVNYVYKNLQKKLLILINEKKAYYEALGFNIENYTPTVADDSYCYFPKNFYRSYQAFNSISFEAIKKRNGINKVAKQTSYYYQPLTYETFDIVINPSILEPVVQVGMNIKLQLTLKPIEKKATPKIKTETKYKYYLVSPDGNVNYKELPTQ
ncbi:SIMPL domain-containing protein [Aurantibacter sp.]|uniref:SIMPL domain-containing protein n=1 Tax=Aurantibacter sp. TaxID=2807103 RepID=UPI0035C7EE68